MYYVYMLRGATGRHYIGQTSDPAARLIQHRKGQTHTTKRFGGVLELVGSREYHTREDAVAVERMLKKWKNPAKALAYLLAKS